VEARAVGEQQANIARAEGVRQANVLQAQGEAQAITTIDEQLRQSPSYLEWLKSQKWDGQLPLVVGGGEGETPFISIPSAEGNGSASATTPITTAE
jgi:prohibitin 2